jgi:hypothetical protein
MPTGLALVVKVVREGSRRAKAGRRWYQNAVSAQRGVVIVVAGVHIPE